MRGLKHFKPLYLPGYIVASFTDAWIETTFANKGNFTSAVASFTDAWIETATRLRRTNRTPSHLLQMRGLKHHKRGYL